MLSLNAAQDIFLNKLNTKYRAFIGGFGSSKTFSGCLDLLMFAGSNPKTRQGYFAPTYSDIKDIFFPTIEEAANLMGFTVDIKVGNKEVHLYRGRVYYGTIICRSMDNPASIVGFKIARALVDEIDILPKDKANLAWNKIVARMRLKIDGVENGISVTTTPEGFKFVYSKFKENPTESYSMVQASTYENQEYLPDDYIDTLKETYPDELIGAYIMGEFVNLTAGTVYRSYNRIGNRSNETIQEKEPLYIGQDFNVDKMASTIYVKREKVWHAVGELIDLFDTPAVIKVIKEKFPEHKITVYPDASGKNRKSNNASESDLSLMEAAGFKVYRNNSNPLIKDRVLAMNKALDNKLVMVNDKECPTVARNLEQQAYDKNGVPDKSSGDDHQNDATTYPIAYAMPIIKPAVGTLRYSGSK
jgi:phage terminase large subunit